MERFTGYERQDGRIGVRNHLAVIPTVSCACGVVTLIAAEVPDALPLYHSQGCCRAGRDLLMHYRALANLGKNPNLGAVLVVGLGCETIQAEHLAGSISESGKPVEWLVIQEEGGSSKTAAKGIEAALRLLEEIRGLERVEAGFEKLTLGLECGGSDAFSGLTANPAVGLVTDWLVEMGGTAILTENTEMIGTSHILERRSRSPEVARDVREMIQEAERRTVEVLGPYAHQAIAPGNMDGGMSTIQEKSLGCIAKGGSTPVNQVVDYAEVPAEKGLVLMDGPGYDTESMTGLAAGGSQIILFTTGRGNPVGFPGVPVIKVASNPRMYRAMEDDMDVNAGAVLEGETLEEVAGEIRRQLLRVACGEESRAEQNRQNGLLCLYTVTPSF